MCESCLDLDSNNPTAKLRQSGNLKTDRLCDSTELLLPFFRCGSGADIILKGGEESPHLVTTHSEI